MYTHVHISMEVRVQPLSHSIFRDKISYRTYSLF